MEKSLVENKPTDPNAEPNENYENLPFHGMQNPPTKVSPCLHNIIFPSLLFLFSLLCYYYYFFPQKPANVLFNANCYCHVLCLLLLLLFISTLSLSLSLCLFFSCSHPNARISQHSYFIFARVTLIRFTLIVFLLSFFFLRPGKMFLTCFFGGSTFTLLLLFLIHFCFISLTHSLLWRMTKQQQQQKKNIVIIIKMFIICLVGLIFKGRL